MLNDSNIGKIDEEVKQGIVPCEIATFSLSATTIKYMLLIVCRHIVIF
jgi:hypothetical protein